MKDYTGHTIVNGELHHASVSGVKAFDVRTKGGCPRRWAYEKVFGFKADKDMNVEAKDKGTALDLELKHYLRTGDKTLSGLALKGLHILEAPGPDLKLDVPISSVEHYWADGRPMKALPDGEHNNYPPGTVHIVKSQLTAAGVPFVGELDLAHERGHFRDDDGEYYDDPPGTVEVADIKFKTNATDRQGNSLFFLPTDMIRDVQMSGYGEWVRRVRPNTTHIRLSMLYFPEKKGLPTKVTRLHVIDDFPKAWARIESVVREMKDVARATDIDQVPGAPDISTCDAYSGCPHREYCTAYRRNSLDKTYGKIAEDHLQEKTVGLLTNNPQIMNQPMQQAPAVDMRAQLANEEAQQRQAQAQQQQQMPQALDTQGLLTVCLRLQGYGYGFPTLAGNAAQAYATAGGQSVAPGAVYQGVPAQAGARRSLHGVQLTEVAHIYQLEGELAKEAAANAPAPQQTFVPPVANIPPANIPWQGSPAAPQQQIAPPMSFLPPDAPQSMPQLAMQGGPQQTSTHGMGIADYVPAASFPVPQALPSPGGALEYRPTIAADATPGAPNAATSAPKAKSPGRPKKSQDAAPGQAAASAQAVPSPSSQPAPAAQAAPVLTSPSPHPGVAIADSVGGAPYTILINARATRLVTRSLSTYVDYINAELSKRYCVNPDGKPGVQDVRCAPKDSPLAFGGWKGAVREVVKADPPPPGDYHLDTLVDELAEAVADALRIVADQNGWLYIRGVRG